MNNESLLIHLKNLFFHIKKKRKIQFIFLLLLTFFTGLTEILSLSSVVPFVQSLTNENFLNEKVYIFNLFTIKNKEHAIIILGLIFSFLYFINCILRIFLTFFISKLSNITSSELSIKVYKSKLYDSYLSHLTTNSKFLISLISQKIGEIAFSINAIINIISGIFIFICIVSVLLWINTKIMIVSLSFFAIFYFILIALGKKTIKKNSIIINEEETNIIGNLQNGLGGIRDILLDNTQDFYLSDFKKKHFTLSRKKSVNDFIQNSPKYILEALGIILFVCLLIYWSKHEADQNQIATIFPTLAALAIATQRILPLTNMIYTNFMMVKSRVSQIKEVVESLNRNLIVSKKDLVVKKSVNFKNSIIFNNVFFSYGKNQEYILENINIEIKKNSRVGIIGKTGAGKSTFLDLLMGLLEPDKGSIQIDGLKLSPETYNSWQSKISHVPQKIFLSDASFAENIAFGKPLDKIDLNRVKLASIKSQIHEFIVKSKKGYNEKVGERGIRLSGGQIQRLGLARALYKDTAEVIIFDEATNSLDIETERIIMKELYSLDPNLTIIIVAHRLNTLNDCDFIFEVKDKRVILIKKNN
jgi:ATP-binding cassette subfamily B protein